MAMQFRRYHLSDGEVFELPKGYVVKGVAKLEINEMTGDVDLCLWLTEYEPEFVMIDPSMMDDDDDEEEDDDGDVPTTPPQTPPGNTAPTPPTTSEVIGSFLNMLAQFSAPPMEQPVKKQAPDKKPPKALTESEQLFSNIHDFLRQPKKQGEE